MAFKFECASCGETHEGMPSFGAAAPLVSFHPVEMDRDERAPGWRLLRLPRPRPLKCGRAAGTPPPRPRPQGPLGLALVRRRARAAPPPAPAFPAGVGRLRARLPATARAGDGSCGYATGCARDAGRQHLRGADRRPERKHLAPRAVPPDDGGL